MCILRVKLIEPSPCLIQVYLPNSSAQYTEFVEETSHALRKVKSNESKNLMGCCNAHVGNGTEGIWKGVIGQRDYANLNVSGNLLL